MTTIEIQVEQSRLNFVIDLLRQLDGVKINAQTIARKKAQIEFVNDTKEALAEAEAHQRGDIQLKTLEAFLNEL
jgi:hypothetical protein